MSRKSLNDLQSRRRSDRLRSLLQCNDGENHIHAGPSHQNNTDEQGEQEHQQNERQNYIEAEEIHPINEQRNQENVQEHLLEQQFSFETENRNERYEVIDEVYIEENLRPDNAADVEDDDENENIMQEQNDSRPLYHDAPITIAENSEMVKHYYCTICMRSLLSEMDICPSCPRRGKNTYFIQLPFLEQLKEMFGRENFYNLLQHRFETHPNATGIMTDIYDGALYRSWYNYGFLSNPNNISFSWYTDGVPVFNSSQISVWPLYLTINELPFEVRKKKENTLLLGLWYGNNKPDMNKFLYAFRPDLEEITAGIEVFRPRHLNPIIVKGILLMGTCDLPARYDCLNFTQYNGYFGCPACFAEGEHLAIGPRSYVHVYPYEDAMILRTSTLCVQLATIATPDNPLFGIRGQTALSRLMPDFIEGMAIDRMHGVDGGVVKKLLTLLFDRAYSNHVFSLYAVINIVDDRLKCIKPPKCIHRMPRTIEDLLHWKCSELKVWFFCYSIPVLEGIMRIDYFQHYLCLVVGLSILNSDTIIENGIDIADDLLHKFVRQFQVMYGVQFCSINIHQLLHLPDRVKSLGPLWTNTCYEYEDINGQILKSIHGTGHIGSQVANSHYQLIKRTRLLDYLQEGEILDFCKKTKYQVKIIEKVTDNCYSVGTYLYMTELPPVISYAIRNFPIRNNLQIYQYLRLLKNRQIYVSEWYSRALQTHSSTVKYLCNNEYNFGTIICFIKLIDCNCTGEICNCVAQHYAIIRKIVCDEVFIATGNEHLYNSSSFLIKCHSTENIVAIPIGCLVSVCVYMKLQIRNNNNNTCEELYQEYVSHFINNKELE